MVRRRTAMTNFVQTTDASTNATSTPAIPALNNGDRLFVSRDATLSALGATSPAIQGAGSNVIAVDGELFSAQDDGVHVGAGHNNVTLDADGVINAFRDGIDLAGGDNLVTVAGAVAASATCLLLGATTGGFNTVFVTSTGS